MIYGEAMLDPRSNEAIRQEIAERLRGLLTRQQTPIPTRLTQLMLRLREKHGHDSRSVAPNSIASETSPPSESWLQRWRMLRRR
jgi:hypothetical protein